MGRGKFQMLVKYKKYSIIYEQYTNEIWGQFRERIRKDEGKWEEFKASVWK